MKFNQNNSYWLFAVLLLTFGIAFNACKREDSLTNNSDWNRPLSSETIEAKAWFDNSVLTNTPVTQKIKPIWQLAKVDRNIVEIPIEINGNLQIPSLVQDKILFGKQRLYFVKSANKSGGAIVNFLPLSEFTGRINDVTILNCQSKAYSGLIMIRDLDNNFIRGFYYENGKFIKKVTTPVNTFNTLNTRTTCEWKEELFACGSVCFGDGSDKVCGEPQCSRTEAFTCVDDPDDPNNPDVPDPNNPCADGSCFDPNCPYGICDEGSGSGNSNNETSDGILNANKATKVATFISKYCNGSVNNHPREAGCDYPALYELTVGQIQANRSQPCYSTVWKFVSQERFRKPGQWGG
jgi:hypothetical protein